MQIFRYLRPVLVVPVVLAGLAIIPSSASPDAPARGASADPAPVQLLDLTTRSGRTTEIARAAWAGISGHAAAGDELAGQAPVGLGARVPGGVEGDRLGGHRGVGEFDGSADLGVEELVAEDLGEPVEDLARVQGALVDHGRQDPVDLEVKID